MKLEEAKQIAEKYIELNKCKYTEMEVVGSIRRQKAEVNDIDIIAIPVVPDKKKIIREMFMGAQIDLYIATPFNFDVLKLIRTGSANHNKKLCFLALRNGWKLKANGEGLLLLTPNNAGALITITSERGILEKLLGKYIEPEQRD